MSMEYEFALKKKGQKIDNNNKLPILVWYPTSIANELSSEILPFYQGVNIKPDPEYEYYSICTTKNLQDVYDYAVENIKALDTHIAKLEKEVENYNQMLPKAENVQIYSKIQEDLKYTQDDVEYAEEEKNKYERIKSDFTFLINILFINQTDYEIVRYCG